MGKVAWCWQCAGGGKALMRPGTLRQAEREAVSHMNTYGHSVGIVEEPLTRGRLIGGIR